MVDFCCPCLHDYSMWTVQHLKRSACTAGLAGPIHNCSSNVAYFTPGKPLTARDIPHTRPNKWWEEAAAIVTMLIFFGCAQTHRNERCIADRASSPDKPCLMQRPLFKGKMSQPMPTITASDACVDACTAWSASSRASRRSFQALQLPAGAGPACRSYASDLVCRSAYR